MSTKLTTRPLFTAQDIAKRVAELGREISNDYRGQPLLVVGVLKGAFIFLADLVRNIECETQIEFISVASYEGTTTTGHVRIALDLATDIENRDVLLVEDIIDTGITIDYLLRMLRTRKPKSLKVCSLLAKPESHAMEHAPDYVGFNISKEFVIGYGLDLDGVYRNLPHIAQVLN